jgi:hypothetical protein
MGCSCTKPQTESPGSSLGLTSVPPSAQEQHSALGEPGAPETIPSSVVGGSLGTVHEPRGIGSGGQPWNVSPDSQTPRPGRQGYAASSSSQTGGPYRTIRVRLSRTPSPAREPWPSSQSSPRSAQVSGSTRQQQQQQWRQFPPPPPPRRQQRQPRQQRQQQQQQQQEQEQRPASSRQKRQAGASYSQKERAGPSPPRQGPGAGPDTDDDRPSTSR